VIELPPKAIKVTDQVCVAQCTRTSLCHEDKAHRGRKRVVSKVFPDQPLNPVAISGQSHVFFGNNNTETRAMV
jgi:hypothetical protein